MATHRRRSMIPAFGIALLVIAWAAPATAQWQIDSKDGNTSVKLGFLAQPQLEIVQTPDPSGPSGTMANSTNMFLRRFRILFGGKVSDKWTFFFETDSPNVGKQILPATTKDAGFIFLQDAFVTYNYNDAFKVDGGEILLGLDHNHLQSAASLLPVDYGPYTFLESTPMQERVGRDYGVEVRGYPFKQHLEYRLGVFQGVRGTLANNTPRVAGRVVWYPFAAETGFFYAGTYQGSKRVVGIGASFDKQKEYGTYGVDAFVEQPIKKGEQGVTLQFDWLRYDGGPFLTALPKQNTYLIEAGYHFDKDRVTPFIQYSARKFVDLPTTPDTWVWQAGVAYWMANHNRNLKIGIGRQHTDGQPDRTQFQTQLQIFFY